MVTNCVGMLDNFDSRRSLAHSTNINYYLCRHPSVNTSCIYRNRVPMAIWCWPIKIRASIHILKEIGCRLRLYRPPATKYHTKARPTAGLFALPRNEPVISSKPPAQSSPPSAHDLQSPLGPDAMPSYIPYHDQHHFPLQRRPWTPLSSRPARPRCRTWVIL